MKAVEVTRETPQLKACPVCGKSPRVIQTIVGDYFVLCFPHAETETVPTQEEAVFQWNSGRVIGRLEMAMAGRDGSSVSSPVQL